MSTVVSDEDAPVMLDRASNIRIFEKLATPHMVDTRRIEEVKQFNQISDLPIGRHHTRVSVTSEREEEVDDIEEQPHRAVAALMGGAGDPEDSIAAIIQDGLRRSQHSPAHHHRPPSQSPENERESGASGPTPSPHFSAAPVSPHQPPSRRSSVQGSPWEPSPRFPVPPQQPSFHRRAEPPLPSSPHQPPLHSSPHQPPLHSSPHRRVEPPPLPRPGQQLPLQTDDHLRELERIRTSATRPEAPSLESMRVSYQQRQNKQYQPPSQGQFQERDHNNSGGPSYMSTFRNLCRTRKAMMAGGSETTGRTGGGGGYKPHADPDYSEKRELIIKLDELRVLGFNVPKFDLCMPLEDLQSEVARRTVSHGTVTTVDTIIGWITTGASILETINNMAGPFLPMENYAKHVEEGTATPRFKYAMYQLVLRWHGRGGSSPWRVILMVLLMPLVQGILIKVVQWLAKGRLSFHPSTISTGVRSLFTMAKVDPNKGVPSGIPGISPDVPREDPPVNAKPPVFPMATTATAEPPLSSIIPNPFADRYPKASEPSVAPTPAPAPTTNEPVQRQKRPRLQRPSEIMSDVQSTASDIPSGIVLTPAQMRAGGTVRV